MSVSRLEFKMNADNLSWFVFENIKNSVKKSEKFNWYAN